jgi:hypothetical protein
MTPGTVLGEAPPAPLETSGVASVSLLASFELSFKVAPVLEESWVSVFTLVEFTFPVVEAGVELVADIPTAFKLRQRQGSRRKSQISLLEGNCRSRH